MQSLADAAPVTSVWLLSLALHYSESVSSRSTLETTHPEVIGSYVFSASAETLTEEFAPPGVFFEA